MIAGSVSVSCYNGLTVVDEVIGQPYTLVAIVFSLGKNEVPALYGFREDFVVINDLSVDITAVVLLELGYPPSEKPEVKLLRKGYFLLEEFEDLQVYSVSYICNIASKEVPCLFVDIKGRSVREKRRPGDQFASGFSSVFRQSKGPAEFDPECISGLSLSDRVLSAQEDHRGNSYNDGGPAAKCRNPFSETVLIAEITRQGSKEVAVDYPKDEQCGRQRIGNCPAHISINVHSYPHWRRGTLRECHWDSQDLTFRRAA